MPWEPLWLWRVKSKLQACRKRATCGVHKIWLHGSQIESASRNKWIRITPNNLLWREILKFRELCFNVSLLAHVHVYLGLERLKLVSPPLIQFYISSLYPCIVTSKLPSSLTARAWSFRLQFLPHPLFTFLTLLIAFLGCITGLSVVDFELPFYVSLIFLRPNWLCKSCDHLSHHLVI